MSWTVNDQEFENVSKLAPPRRYRYFIKRVADWRELWGLWDEGGWSMKGDATGREYFAVWPHPRYAEACATGAWAGRAPMAIDLDEWLEAWLPGMERDGIRAAVFPTPRHGGVAVTPGRLREDLRDELELME